MKGKCAGNRIFVEINHGFMQFKFPEIDPLILTKATRSTRVPPGILPPPWPVQATVRPNPPEPGPPRQVPLFFSGFKSPNWRYIQYIISMQGLCKGIYPQVLWFHVVQCLQFRWPFILGGVGPDRSGYITVV